MPRYRRFGAGPPSRGSMRYAPPPTGAPIGNSAGPLRGGSSPAGAAPHPSWGRTAAPAGGLAGGEFEPRGRGPQPVVGTHGDSGERRARVERMEGEPRQPQRGGLIELVRRAQDVELLGDTAERALHGAKRALVAHGPGRV